MGSVPAGGVPFEANAPRAGDPIAPASPAIGSGRLLVLAAAILWSLSGAFAKILTQDTGFGLETPLISPLAIAFYRAMFGGMMLALALRRDNFSFSPIMLIMIGFFAAMNASFMWALARGTAANAILLQYTAPLWMYGVSVWWLGESADRRGLAALATGLAGVAIMIAGGWSSAKMPVVAVGLGSGMAYAGVILCLRVLRGHASAWLTVMNHLGAALMLIPWVWSMVRPNFGQLGVLFLFGTVQMALPYWLIARALRSVSAQEVGTITLLEPILNPIWAFLVASEKPSLWTMAGGSLVLGALAWRYWPSAIVRPRSRSRREPGTTQQIV